MSYSILVSLRFKKEAKRLVKKYPSLKAEPRELNADLARNPQLGTPLGHGAYKIRLAIKSKGKGKSGGARVITYLVSEAREVYLLAMYDKGELSTIDDKTLRRIITELRA